MRKPYSLFLVFALICSGLSAQSSLDAVLAEISVNNKSLLAQAQRVQAYEKGLQTGLWLYNPEVSYDFMKGFPTTAGNQSDLTISQSFDFPSAYARRRDLAQLKSAQVAFETAALRQSVLLEAKLACLELIYLNRRKTELVRRLGDAERFLAAMQTKYDALDATALDLNKARQQVIYLKTAVKLVDSEISGQLTLLAELNGGKAISFADTLYPNSPELPPLEELRGLYESADPVLSFFKAQRNIGDAEIALTKALTLPKMEAGYRYQGILGQDFHGLHLGVTVPLWENKNRVAHQQLQTIFFEGKTEEQRNRINQELVRLYQQYSDLRESLEEFRQSIQSINTPELLDKALQAGQITTLEYLLEQSLLYEGRDQLLELEQAVEVTAAKLWKHIL